MNASHGLDPSAYRPLEEGEEYPPYVPASQSPIEVTVRTVIAGIFFGFALPCNTFP